MPLFNLFAEMTLNEKLTDALTVAIVGMGTVFIALFLIGELFVVLHRVFHSHPQGEDPEPSPKSKLAHAPQPTIEPHLIPILVAAATAAVGRRVALRRITFINRNTVSGWGEAGRASIQTSHNLRRTM